MNNLMKRGGNGVSTPAVTFGTLVDNFFQENLSRFFDEDVRVLKSLNVRGAVPVNIGETDKAYELQVIAPGIKKDDFKISVSDDMLTVGFERRQEDQQGSDKKRWLRREYRHESFSRSFPLDDAIDSDRIAAKYEDGVLYLELPKKEGPHKPSRLIEIR